MFGMSNTSMQSLPPLANSCINNVLLQSAPHLNQSLFKFVQVIGTSLVYSLPAVWRLKPCSRLGSSRGCLAATDQ